VQQRSRTLALAAAAGLGWMTHAQTPRIGAAFAPLPATKADVGRWDALIVRRAEAILASAAQWTKADTGDCARGAKTFSISCALDQAYQEAAGISEGTAGIAGEVGSATRSDCRFRAAGSSQEGACGMLFDEVPIITIARAPAVTTGVWRKDIAPSEVWAGKMGSAEYPVMYEAEKLVGTLTTKRYDDPVVDYNNDPSTTFADVQALFTALEDRVTRNAAADLEGDGPRRGATADVEIETYANGTGVIRTSRGWFPIVNYSAPGSSPRFQIDLKAEVPANDLDRQIIQRAAALIATDAVWNRSDNRQCPSGARTVSIYCADRQATIEVTGGFHHRRPALELVRVIIEQRTKDKKYDHRLMDYNNDPTTTLADVKSLFAEALTLIK
jgi:hypothetical protein